jgi:EAL domain-containing protein (putative c-di-GMP-specific phosphodiesterase class I)
VSRRTESLAYGLSVAASMVAAELGLGIRYRRGRLLHLCVIAIPPLATAAWLERRATRSFRAPAESTGSRDVTDHGSGREPDEVLWFTGVDRAVDIDRHEAADTVTQLSRQRVEEVLADGGLSIVVQPIYSLETGRVVGVEALSRFAGEPAQGPDKWFAEAHRHGLGVALEVLAVETALRVASALPAEVYVSVNVSPETLTSAALRAAVTTGAIPADRIVLELTEHASVDDYDPLTEALSDLRGRGMRLAIDDAGAGFASFRHILRLRPDLIKVDQAITRGIHNQPAHRAFAAALVMFGLDVGSVTIVAEGIETAEELRTIASLGIDAAQGYFLGRPAPADAEWPPMTNLMAFHT